MTVFIRFISQSNQ